MANAFKCDRCGRFYVDEYMGSLSPKGYNVCDTNAELDLCPTCLKELDDWLDLPSIKDELNEMKGAKE